MKKDKLLSAFGDIDDKFVAEARPKGQRTLLIRNLAIAASLLVIIGAVLLLALNGNPDKAVYKQNPHFLSAIIDYIGNIQAGDLIYGAGDTPGGEGPSPNSSYVETTDNQVDGIIEGDVCKTTKNYIFRLGNHTVYIYYINGIGSKLVSEYIIPYIDGERSYIDYDMFLSEDGNTLTLFGKYNDSNDVIPSYGKTVVMSIDVSDPFNPRESERVIIRGERNTVRKIGDKFYLITNWTFSANRIDPDNPESFIPSIDYGSHKHICASDKIIYPDKISSMRYKYVTVLSEGDLSLSDEMALMLSGDVYFTKSNIVFNSNHLVQTSENDKNVNRIYTKIGVLSFENGLKFKGYIDIEGMTLNQYSYDEKDGALRIVASLANVRGTVVEFDSASLYVYDANTLEKIASVDSFAPNGEGVTAVRFEGDKLYVCTAKIATYTDPVYFFDLSDYSNITSADTGFIDGFSSYLIDYGEGYLLGVGRQNLGTNKLEVYKREGDEVVSVDEYLFGGTVCTEYKSFLIDRENNLFGLSVQNYTANGSDKKSIYLVLKLTDGKLSVICELGKSDNYARAFTRDGEIYLTLHDSLYVYSPELNYVQESKNAHTAGEWTLLKEPSCGEHGLLQQTCSCGRVTTKNDYSAETTNHELSDGICINCGKDVGSAKKNAALIIYTSNGDGTCTVTGTRGTVYGNVVIPDKSPKGEAVVKIGNTAFYSSGVTSITLPDSVKVIEGGAFASAWLTSIDLSAVTEIGNFAFMECKALTEVKFSDSLKKIGNQAFIYCEALTELIIPDSVNEIGINVFEHCDMLERVKLPKGITVISAGLFNQCRSLREIVIPDSVTLIDGYAFNYCQSLSSVIIPDSVTTVEMRVFGACSRLSHVTLGSGVKTIGEDAFKDCVKLVDVVNRSELDIQAGSEDHGMIGLYAPSISKNGNNLVTVGDYVFYISDEKNILVSYNGSDTVLNLPEIEGGYEIGNRAFYQNKSITEINIPDGVTAIGEETFRECYSLSSVTLPDSVKTVGYRAFLNCRFTSFDMGNGVASVGEQALANCRNLSDLHISESLELIGQGAFSDCRALTSLELPGSLKQIGAEAFYGCISISSVVIHEGITVIERDAFRNCSSLESIVIPESVVEIKDAFYVSNKLKTVCYRGSEEQWASITIAHNNGLFFKVNIIYNYSE